MESAMSIFQRIVLLIKVLVILSLGATAAWASYPAQDHGAGFSTGMAGSGFHAVYADDPDEGDEEDEEEEGDSQT
jgi:hypothetical protein